jgi:hypothetical protein
LLELVSNLADTDGILSGMTMKSISRAVSSVIYNQATRIVVATAPIPLNRTAVLQIRELPTQNELAVWSNLDSAWPCAYTAFRIDSASEIYMDIGENFTFPSWIFRRNDGRGMLGILL